MTSIYIKTLGLVLYKVNVGFEKIDKTTLATYSMAIARFLL